MRRNPASNISLQQKKAIQVDVSSSKHQMYLRQKKVFNPKSRPHKGLIWPPTSPFGAQSPVFEGGEQNGKNQYKIKMGKINTFYGLPNQPVCFQPMSKHGRRQIPGSRFKSFGESAAATKLIRCRRNFLKIQRLRPSLRAESIQRTFVDANARSYKSYKENNYSARHSYSIAQMMTQSFISLQNTGTRLLGKMLMGEEVVE